MTAAMRNAILLRREDAAGVAGSLMMGIELQGDMRERKGASEQRLLSNCHPEEGFRPTKDLRFIAARTFFRRWQIADPSTPARLCSG